MRRLARFLALPAAERSLLAEAAAALALARVLLTVLPFAVAMRLAGLHASAGRRAPVPGAPADAAVAIGGAITRVAPHLPFCALCLPQAMASTLMLRRRGLPVTVHFGVAKDVAGSLDAHAWSVSGDAVVTGAAGRERFTPIAVFAA